MLILATLWFIVEISVFITLKYLLSFLVPYNIQRLHRFHKVSVVPELSMLTVML